MIKLEQSEETFLQYIYDEIPHCIKKYENHPNTAQALANLWTYSEDTDLHVATDEWLNDD